MDKAPCSETEARFAAALSDEGRARDAERALTERLTAQLGDEAPDLLFVFATHHYGTALEELGTRLARATGAGIVLGCTAQSVIGEERELEGRPGMAAWAARLPGTELRSFHARAFREDEGAQPTFDTLPPVGETERSSMLLLADPFTFPVEDYLDTLNERWPGLPVLGGMASGATAPGQTLLFTEEGVKEGGALGVVLEGEMELVPVVSQGCRPVGKPWVVTECERNHIKKLGGRPALEALMETWNTLPREDRELLQSAPFLGLASEALQGRSHRSDFLVRSIMGLHQRERSIAVTDFVRRGQTVQLLVRDADSAGNDLRHLLSTKGRGALHAGNGHPPGGALLFSCNGRGKRMFGKPHHDIGCVREGLEGDAAIAGFFAAGEIGPVGSRNFVHGFSAAVAVFRPRTLVEAASPEARNTTPATDPVDRDVEER